jgi:molybdate transport system substrate-binding protein
MASSAPADISISADLDWMDYLQKRKLIKVAPARGGTNINVKPGFDLVGMLKGRRLAMTGPDSVPAG